MSMPVDPAQVNSGYNKTKVWSHSVHLSEALGKPCENGNKTPHSTYEGTRFRVHISRSRAECLFAPHVKFPRFHLRQRKTLLHIC